MYCTASISREMQPSPNPVPALDLRDMLLREEREDMDYGLRNDIQRLQEIIEQWGQHFRLRLT